MYLIVDSLNISADSLLAKLGINSIAIQALVNRIELNEEKCVLNLEATEDELNSDAVDALKISLKNYLNREIYLRIRKTGLTLAQNLVLHWKEIRKKAEGNISCLTESVYPRAVNDTLVEIFVSNEFSMKQISKKSGLLSEIIVDIIGENVDFEFKIDENKREKIEKESSIALNSPIESVSFQPMKEENIKSTGKKAKENGNVNVIGKPIKTVAVPVKQVVFNDSFFTVNGEVFSTEYRENFKIFNFGIYDGEDSIKCVCFREVAEFASEIIKNGDEVTVNGKAGYDSRTSTPTLYVNSIQKEEKKSEKKDDYPGERKRIELHAHSQLSAMDSILRLKEIIKTVSKWGHKAISITDHGVVQSFPELYETCKKEGIKAVFGSEGYLVDITPIVYNLKYLSDDLENKKTDEIDYVVFDFETTGLSPLTDDIIEIGAVKISKGQEISKFSELIDPKRDIPLRVQEITNITPDMLKGMPDIKTVLPKFLEYIEGCVLVAHNANFDYRFLKQQVKKVLDKDINMVYIDTLSFSRAMITMKSYGLGKLVKKLGLGSFNHHRAYDDASVTGKLLLKLFDMTDKIGKNTLPLIDSLKSEIDLVNLRGKNFTLYVKNKKGLRNLYEVITKSHLEFFGRGIPLIPKTLINEKREGLILGTGSPASELAEAYRFGVETEELEQIAMYYDFIEIMPPDAYTEVDEGFDSDLLKKMYHDFFLMGKRIGIPIIMTGNVHYLSEKQKKEWAILKISDKAMRRRGQTFPSNMLEDCNLHLRNTQEMIDIAKEITGDEKEAENIVINNVHDLCDSIEEIQPITRKLHPPIIEGADDEIRDITARGVKDLYGDNPPEIIVKRVERELDGIIGNGYSVLYLIAQKIVQKSREDGYLVGSRGSVGSSLVATMLGITEVNPMPAHYVCPECRYSEFIEDGSVTSGYDLPDKKCPNCGNDLGKYGQDIPFETFMGFKGNKVPDIDLNFSGEYQTKAHRYIEELFGSDHVFKAGTISTVADKTAYGYVLRYEEVTGDKLKDIEKERISAVIAGVKRTTGQHPGGLMIVPSDREVFEFTPVQKPANDKNSEVRTTHFDYHSIHDDLVKIDALGHDDPTFMRYLQDITNLDPLEVPMDDREVIQLFNGLKPLKLKRGDIPDVDTGTLGIPEFGTSFVRGLLKETKPSCFADLVRISGLSHGTDVWLGNARDIILGGKATLSEVIACRDDIMNDLIYRGMVPIEAFGIMEKVRKGKGLSGEEEKKMTEHNVKPWFLESCKKIKYLFPKAHAVAYVSMAFRVAYFKLRHPMAFYATYFTVKGEEFNISLILSGKENLKEWLVNPVGTESISKQKFQAQKVVNEIALEMLLRGYEFLPVDIFKSDAQKFTIEEGKLRIPLSRVSGLGIRAAESVIKAREESEFVSIDDLNRRTGLSKTIIEVLKEMGSLGDLKDQAQFTLF